MEAVAEMPLWLKALVLLFAGGFLFVYLNAFWSLLFGNDD